LYNESHTHLSLKKDAPIPRDVQSAGRVLALPVLASPSVRSGLNIRQGQPYKNASGRFKTLVNSCAKSAQKQEQRFRAFQFHDLRHRHAVDWLKSGRSIFDLRQRLGHSSVKTTGVYLGYLTGEEQRRAKCGTEQKPEQEQRFWKIESEDN
jgi:integrase